MSAIAILIPGFRKEPWLSMQRAQQETWMTELPEQVHVYYFYGRDEVAGPRIWSATLRERFRFGRRGCLQRIFDVPLNRKLRRSEPIVTFSKEELWIGLPGDLATMGARTVAAMEYVLGGQHYDFIFRSNLSSYVCGQRLLKFCDDHPGIGYGGHVEDGQMFWGWDFVNGAGILLSRENAKALVHYKRQIDHRYLDDVAFGKLFLHLGIRPVHIARPLLTKPHDVHQLTSEELRAFHFRVRTVHRPRNDDAILRLLHKRVSGSD